MAGSIHRRSNLPSYILWATVAALLLAPLVAMRFTSEVAWTPFDFAAAGALLIGATATYEWASRRTASPRHRILLGAGLAAAVLVIWAEGAVGIF